MSTDPQAGLGGDDPTEPVIRDRRRIDPLSGEVRDPAAASPSDTSGAADEQAVSDDLARAQATAEEHLADLQRLQAEYVNYRKRVERDRDIARTSTLEGVVEAFIPVLDDIDLARQHGELVGPFAAVSEKAETVLARFGWERYGAAGEEFDPAVHEALMHSHSEDVTGPTVVQVLQPGHRVGDRIIRAARVAVAEPPA